MRDCLYTADSAWLSGDGCLRWRFAEMPVGTCSSQWSSAEQNINTDVLIECAVRQAVTPEHLRLVAARARKHSAKLRSFKRMRTVALPLL